MSGAVICFSSHILLCDGFREILVAVGSTLCDDASVCSAFLSTGYNSFWLKSASVLSMFNAVYVTRNIR